MKFFTKHTTETQQSFIKNLSRKLNRYLQVRVIKKSLILTTLLFIFACSNTYVGVQYYSLNAISSKATPPAIIENNANTTFLIINKIELADFLETGGLVMQVNAHQIQISNQHLWGDKLPKAISTHLINSLSNSKNKLFVESTSATNADLADVTLSISFEQFTITHQHETVISGFYKIDSASDNKKSKKIFFDIRQPLTIDGYTHVVTTFKKSLHELSTQIQKEL